MSMMILDSCDACGACVDACPTRAIHLRADGRAYEVDRDLCGEWADEFVSCRCAAACPIEGCLVRDLPFATEPASEMERYWEAVLA